MIQAATAATPAQNVAEPSNDAMEGDATARTGGTAPAVRFKSTIEEIAPDEVVPVTSTSPDVPDRRPNRPEGEEVTPEQIRALSASLQGSHLQGRRANIFAFEPYSLPASRVSLSYRLRGREGHCALLAHWFLHLPAWAPLIVFTPHIRRADYPVVMMVLVGKENATRVRSVASLLFYESNCSAEEFKYH